MKLLENTNQAYTSREVNYMSREFKVTVDAREYAPKDKHRVIFERFDELQPGESMLLKNDHDPKPLQYQFMMERPGIFGWEYIEEGPTVWQVEIKRV